MSVKGNLSRRDSTPVLIADYGCHTGENPLWNPVDEHLYWCDIPAGRIFRFDPVTGHHEICFEGGVVGGFTVESDGALLLFMAKGAIRRWHCGALTTIIEEVEEERESRFNDVIADPCGRVFCGTMPTPHRPGRLYRLDTNGTLAAVLEGIGCANGMAFSLDRKKMYFTDSAAGEVYAFDYNEQTGSLANQHVFVSARGDEGVPDGATVDAEGYLWSARWDGGCIVRYAPEGAEDTRIPMPAGKVSSLTFGGRNYSDLYVTTAGGNAKSDNGQAAGALFRLRLGIRGVPEFYSRINESI